jgi:FkbM family methyltransferase
VSEKVDGRGAVLAPRLFGALLEACYSAEPGAGTGWDLSREWSNPRGLRAKDAVARAAARAGFGRRRFDVEPAAAALAGIATSLPGLERTYALLADEPSRDLLVRLLVFRALGPHHVALPVRSDQLARACERIERERRTGPATVSSPYAGELGLYEVPGRSGPVRLNAHPLTVHEFFELEQYAYRDGGVAPEPGEAAVDGGGGWGDTALWLADAVGTGGRVTCAEFEPANRAMIDANLALNPELAERITVVESALWAASGERLEYAPAGPSSSLVSGTAGVATERAEVETVTLDDLVDREGIERLDFLKLDVESAELEALRGAERTLRRDRPKLAVAAYHRAEDLVELPAFIDGLGLGYELYLGHFTPGREETVLFAGVPRHQPR